MFIRSPGTSNHTQIYLLAFVRGKGEGRCLIPELVHSTPLLRPSHLQSESPKESVPRSCWAGRGRVHHTDTRLGTPCQTPACPGKGAPHRPEGCLLP